MGRDIVPAARPWRVGDATYPVRRLTPLAFQELINLARAQTPDPAIRAREIIQNLPPEVARHVWDDLMHAAPPWPPGLGSPEFVQAMMSPEGAAALIFHACRKAVPGFTREQAARLADEVTDEEFEALMEAALPAPESPGGESEPGDRPTAGPGAGPIASPSDPPMSPTETRSA